MPHERQTRSGSGGCAGSRGEAPLASRRCCCVNNVGGPRRLPSVHRISTRGSSDPPIDRSSFRSRTQARSSPRCLRASIRVLGVAVSPACGHAQRRVRVREASHLMGSRRSRRLTVQPRVVVIRVWLAQPNDADSLEQESGAVANDIGQTMMPFDDASKHSETTKVAMCKKAQPPGAGAGCSRIFPARYYPVKSAGG